MKNMVGKQNPIAELLNLRKFPVIIGPLLNECLKTYYEKTINSNLNIAFVFVCVSCMCYDK